MRGRRRTRLGSTRSSAPPDARELRRRARRLAAMPTLAAAIRSILVGGLVVSAAACAAGASPLPSGSPTGTDSPTPSSSAASDEPGGVGGGSQGDPGRGIVDPGTGIGAPANPAPIDPGAGQPTIVRPKPGRPGPPPAAPQRLEASVDGRHVLVKITWYGGVAPCSVLDSVDVRQTGTTIALTVIEGADEVGVMCPEIAMLKATIVDLGDLAPGTWRISAPNGDAVPLEITIV